VDGQWFEVESTEEAGPPRSYYLAPAAIASRKILCGYEEYDPETALKAGLDVNDA